MFLDKINNEILYGIAIDLGESLNEMATALIDDENNIRITVNPDKNRNLNGKEGCYFKVYNNKNVKKATKIARIMFTKCEYVYHNGNDGKLIWDMNSKEKCLLLQLLNQQCEEYTDYTVWQYTLMQFNLEAFDITHHKSMSNSHDGLSLNLKIPDYTKLEFDSKKNK